LTSSLSFDAVGPTGGPRGWRGCMGGLAGIDDCALEEAALAAGPADGDGLAAVTGMGRWAIDLTPAGAVGG